jgi:hypothetical protein
MKKAVILLIVLFIAAFSTNSFAKSPRYKPAKIVEIYLDGINHECQGVSESSILFVTKLKFKFPDEDYSKILTKLDYIASTDSSETKRLLAMIASTCIKSPEHFKWIENASHEDMIEFHQILAGN